MAGLLKGSNQSENGNAESKQKSPPAAIGKHLPFYSKFIFLSLLFPNIYLEQFQCSFRAVFSNQSSFSAVSEQFSAIRAILEQSEQFFSNQSSFSAVSEQFSAIRAVSEQFVSIQSSFQLIPLSVIVVLHELIECLIELTTIGVLCDVT